jgi:hypothetical protein
MDEVQRRAVGCTGVCETWERGSSFRQDQEGQLWGIEQPTPLSDWLVKYWQLQWWCACDATQSIVMKPTPLFEERVEENDRRSSGDSCCCE